MRSGPDNHASAKTPRGGHQPQVRGGTAGTRGSPRPKPGAGESNPAEAPAGWIKGTRPLPRGAHAAWRRLEKQAGRARPGGSRPPAQFAPSVALGRGRAESGHENTNPGHRPTAPGIGGGEKKRKGGMRRVRRRPAPCGGRGLVPSGEGAGPASPRDGRGSHRVPASTRDAGSTDGPEITSRVSGGPAYPRDEAGAVSLGAVAGRPGTPTFSALLLGLAAGDPPPAEPEDDLRPAMAPWYCPPGR